MLRWFTLCTFLNAYRDEYRRAKARRGWDEEVRVVSVLERASQSARAEFT